MQTDTEEYSVETRESSIKEAQQNSQDGTLLSMFRTFVTSTLLNNFIDQSPSLKDPEYWPKLIQ